MAKLKVWETKEYYDQAHEAGGSSHPGLLLIKELGKKAASILEVGCGEGSKLNLVVKGQAKGFGVDISQTAIRRAKKQYPQLTFQVADAEQLPFPEDRFDLVFSAFTLEHLSNPEKVLKEMIRVLKPSGKLALLAPNYGAPNRASPCFEGSRVKKLAVGLLKDWVALFRSRSLNWRPVQPKAKPGRYEIDWDTTVEPYLGSLKHYLTNQGVKIVKVDSFWGKVETTVPSRQKPFSWLGKLGVYPFKYWGPHLLLVGEKSNWPKPDFKKKILGMILVGIAFLLPLTIPLLIGGALVYLVKKRREVG